jgi:membrane protease YdiL (CAAX protease family)
LLEPVRWRAVEGIGIFIVAVIATILFSLPFGIALRPISGCGNLSGIASRTCFHHRDLFIALSVGINELALLTTVLLWVRILHKSGPRKLGFRRFSAKNVFMGVGIGAGGVLLAGLISQVLVQIVEHITNRPVETPQQINVSDKPGGAVLAIIAVSVIVLAPLAEEAFFRGFVFQAFRRWARPAWAIILSAVVFGLAHLIPLIILPIMSLGILLAAVVERRGSLVPSIFAHATFNAIGFAQLFIAHVKPF